MEQSVCVTYLGENGTRMHYGTRASWHMHHDALCIVQLWYLGPCIHVDINLICTTNLISFADSLFMTREWMTMSYQMKVASLCRIMCPSTLQILFRNGLRNMVKSSRHSLGFQIPISQSAWCAGQTYAIHRSQVLLLISWCQISRQSLRS